MMKYEVTECRRGDLHFGSDSLRWPKLVILGILLTFFEDNKVKGYIFKFVWLQSICKSKMAAFKYFSNKIDMNHAGQCYLIRNREGGIGANMAIYFHGTLHKCVSTMAALPQNQVKSTT